MGKVGKGRQSYSVFLLRRCFSFPNSPQVTDFWIFGSDTTAWDLSTIDLLAWENFLSHAMNLALDSGVDSNTLLDFVACTISQNRCPTFVSSVRVAELLMSRFDMAEARQIPTSILDFVSDVLHSSYPPKPDNKVMSLWMIRSLTRLIDTCPLTLVESLLGSVQEGLSIWVSDEWRVFSQDEYSFDVREASFSKEVGY